MKNLGKYCALAAVAWAAWMGWCQMDNPAQDPWVNGVQATDGAVELLFTIEAKHGSLIHLKGDQYELAIPVKEIKSVLAFSDRPDRVAFRMDPAKYSELVYSGSNSFDMDPPNVVLSWGDHKYAAAAFEVMGHRRLNGYLMYSLRKLDQKKITTRGGPVHQKGKVAIFIDEYEVSKSDCLGTGGTMKVCSDSA